MIIAWIEQIRRLSCMRFFFLLKLRKSVALIYKLANMISQISSASTHGVAINSSLSAVTAVMCNEAFVLFIRAFKIIISVWAEPLSEFRSPQMFTNGSDYEMIFTADMMRTLRGGGGIVGTSGREECKTK